MLPALIRILLQVTHTHTPMYMHYAKSHITDCKRSTHWTIFICPLSKASIFLTRSHRDKLLFISFWKVLPAFPFEAQWNYLRIIYLIYSFSHTQKPENNRILIRSIDSRFYYNFLPEIGNRQLINCAPLARNNVLCSCICINGSQAVLNDMCSL